MNDSSTISKLSKAFTLETRYENEYEEISLLGKGGFSSVYKVRNLLDHSLSAIKKIVIKVTNKNKHNIQKEVENVVQEIRCLAKIKSDFVVNFKLSWIEVKLKKGLNIYDIKPPQMNDEDEQSFELSYDTISLQKEDDFIEFHQSSRISDDKITINEGKTAILKEDSQNSINKKTFLGSSKIDVDQIDNLIIYIQMELCKETLYDYIKRRNSNVKQSLSKFLEENEINILNNFLRICKALDFIHTNEKLIHRDLKPKNIFFNDQDEIKLGDFGLATYSSILDDITVSSPKNDKNNGKLSFKDTFNLDVQNEKLGYDASFSGGECHTKNIGTPQYAAPEQLNQNNYDQKADIYSLGLVLFDLAYPFKTEMEKKIQYEEIKLGNVTKVIKENFPIISKLLTSMISNIPNSRPKAKEIIILLNEYINQTDRSKDSLSNNKGQSTCKKFSRKRFFSEDITKIKSYELLMKESVGRNVFWKNIWVKIVNEKLLIFNQSNALKASLCYDIKECRIKGKYEEEEEANIRDNIQRHSHKNLRGGIFVKSLSFDSIFDESIKKEYENIGLIRQINYVIEIDDPYLCRCYIKSKNLIDSMEFYNQVVSLL